MSQKITKYESTPNPNAVKCWLDPGFDGAIRSFRKADDAASDPVAATLFSVPGVNNLLISGSWMTVGKEEGAGWPSVKAEVERVLAELP
ncbi:MAG: NifU N-terminal domain-containing protein [Planctomycetota bacterium]